MADFGPEAKQRAREFIAEMRAHTVCAGCGAQPVLWCTDRHAPNSNKRVNHLVSQGYAILRIANEALQCTPLCRSCKRQAHPPRRATRPDNVCKHGHEHEPGARCKTCAREYHKRSQQKDMAMRHTTAHRGKRLNIILKTGDRFVDKVTEVTDRAFVFETHGKILKENVRSAAFARATVIRFGDKRR